MINLVANLIMIVLFVLFIIITYKGDKLNKQILKIKKEIEDNQIETIKLLIEQNNSLKKIINNAVKNEEGTE